MGRLSISKLPLFETNQSININDILTDSLLVEILQRLPCHSALRAKSVCKRWFDLLSDPYFFRSFIHYHDQNCRISHHTLIYEFSYWNRHLTEALHFRIHADSKHPVFKSRGFNLDFLPGVWPWKSKPILAVASHKDLLVCYDPKRPSQGGVYIICNPLTKQWLSLPPAPGWHRVADTAIGFIASDNVAASRYTYKLVRVPELGSRPSSNQVEVEVLSSEIGEWRKFVAICSRSVERTWQFKPNAVTFKNKLHWLVNGENIAVFDPFEGARGSFRVIDLPLELNSEMGVCLGSCGEHLKVSQITGGYLHRMLVIWKLGDYAKGNWQLENKISLKEMVLVDRCLHDFKYLTAEVLAFHPSEAEILYLRLNNQIMNCNVGKRTLDVVSECLGDSNFSIGTRGAFLLLHPCWPSPVPPLFHDVRLKTFWSSNFV